MKPHVQFNMEKLRDVFRHIGALLVVAGLVGGLLKGVLFNHAVATTAVGIVCVAFGIVDVEV